MLDIAGVKDAFEQDANLLGAQAVADLAKGYANAWEKLYAGWKPLAARVIAAREAGMPIRPGDLYRMERFTAMMAQAQAAYGEIAAQGLVVGLSTANASFDMALQDYRAGVRDLAIRGIAVPNAGDWNVSVDREAVMAALGYSATGGPLHDLFAAVSVDGVKATRRALVSGIVAGKGTDQIARDMRKVMALNLYRSQLIARTEAHRVYREVSRRNAEANPDAFDGWMWRAACDARTCAICWSKHGTLHPAKEVMVSHPGCRCAAVPNPRSFASIVGEPIPDATAIYRTKGAELFAAKGAGTQLRVLGPRRFERYQSGMRLSQMVEDGPRNRWGRTPRLIPLRRLGGIPPAGHWPGASTALPAPVPPPALPAPAAAPHRGMREDERLRNARQIAAGKAPLEWNGKNWGIPGRARQATPVRRPRVVPAPLQAPVVAPAAGGGAQVPLTSHGGVAGRPRPPKAVAGPGQSAMVGGAHVRVTSHRGAVVQAPQSAPKHFPGAGHAGRSRGGVPVPALRSTLPAGRPAQRVPVPHAPGFNVLHPAVPPGARAMRETELRAQERRAVQGMVPLQWSPTARRWVPPPRVPTPAPLFPARPAAVGRVGGRDVLLPPVPAGARPMIFDEMKRQQKRADAGQGDLVWKPNRGVMAGQGHWGRALLQSRTRSVRAQVAFPSRPSMLVNNPAGGQQIQHPPIPRGARAMNDAELARQERYYLQGQGRLVWKPDAGGVLGQGHWGRPVRRAPTPANVAPAPVPQAAMGHAPRGGAEPRPAVLAAGGAQLRRWRRWQAENPNAPVWQEPSAAYLQGKAPRAKIATIGPLAGVRGGERLALRKLAEQTAVFGGKRAKTGQNQPMGWDPQRRRLGRALRGEFSAARLKSASRAQRAAIQRQAMHAQPGVPGLVRPAFAPPTVLKPLPAPKIVKPHTPEMTGTHKGMTPRTPPHPLAAAEPRATKAGRADDPVLNHALTVGRIVRQKAVRGGSSSDGFEAWIDDGHGGEIHVYIKPTSGQSSQIRGGGHRSGVMDFTETEREYAASRLNHILGDPLDHQTSVIRDFGTATFEKYGSPRPIGRAVVNVWTDAPPGWSYREQPSFRQFPDSERATASMFDALIFNTDRHGGNYSAMVDPQGQSHIIAIDPSLAFPFDKDASRGTSHGHTQWTDTSYPISPSDMNRLEGLLRNEVEVRAEFEPLIGQNATDGMFKRARWMWQHGRTLSTRDLDDKVWWAS